MEGNIVQFPSNEKPWDGDATQSRRHTAGEGYFVNKDDEEAEADRWIEQLGLPPRLEGELWHQWAERTEKERNVGGSLPAEQEERETA